MTDYNVVFNKVCETIADAKDLDIEELTPDVSLLQLNLDSLDYVELMVLTKREFGVALTADDFAKNPTMTLGELCEVVAAGKTKQ